MGSLKDFLDKHVSAGTLPSAVALVAHADHVEIEAAGLADTETSTPIGRDSIFRIASITWLRRFRPTPLIGEF